MELHELERSVISAAISGEYETAVAVSILSEKDFGSDQHRAIWQAIVALSQEGVDCNSFSITEYLRRHRKLAIAGGASYISTIEDYIADVANIEYYCKLLVKYSQMNQLKHMASQADHFEDPDKLIVYLQGKMDDILSNGIAEAADASDVVNELLHEAITPDDRVPGLGTGLDGIDRFFSGIERGEVFIIAARPGVGKSALATNIVMNNLDKNVLLFSLEMGKKAVMARIIGASERINTRNFKTGKFDMSGAPNDIERIEHFKAKHQGMNLFIDERGDLNVAVLRAIAQNIKLKHGLDLIVIDYLQLMSGEGDSRNAQITNISRGIKCLAKDLNVPIIALSQITRDRERREYKEEYTLSELRESGSIEQDADKVLFIIRKEGERQGVFQIAKHRDGPVGRAPFYYTPEYCLFEDMSIEEWLNKQE